MIILAIDTATDTCSVALIQNQNILAEIILTDGRTHSVNLLPMIKKVLNKCGLRPIDLSGFAVSVGPGTFTGLRIGISTIKGMAYASNKPVVGVNSLDALAFPLIKSSLPVVSMIDARRGEVYYAVYNLKRTQMGIEKKTFYNVASPEVVIANIPYNAVMVGSGATVYSDFFKKELKKIKFKNCFNKIKASSVALIASRRFASGDVDRIETLVPYYIRKSDAQIYMGL